MARRPEAREHAPRPDVRRGRPRAVARGPRRVPRRQGRLLGRCEDRDGVLRHRSVAVRVVRRHVRGDPRRGQALAALYLSYFERVRTTARGRSSLRERTSWTSHHAITPASATSIMNATTRLPRIAISRAWKSGQSLPRTAGYTTHRSRPTHAASVVEISRRRRS